MFKQDLKTQLMATFKNVIPPSARGLILEKETSFIDEKLNILQNEVSNLQLNHYGVQGIVDLIFMSCVYIRLNLWKSFIMEVISRIISKDV